MERGNLNLQHQFQEQFTGYYSSFSSQPAEYSKVSSISDLNPEAAGIILNISSNTHNNYLTDCIPNSSVSLPPVSMTQGLSFCHASSFNQQSAAGELLLGKTKEEFPDSFCKLSDMMHTSSNVEETDFMSSKYEHQNSHDLENLQNLSACRRYNFSHILPTINISKSDLCSSLVSSSLDLNIQTMDLLSTSTYDGDTSSSQSSENTLDHFMRELKDSPSNSYNNTSTFEDGYGRKKRPSSVSQLNNFLAEAKKNRPAPPSCPTLKVRKEKLGDRIAALQRLVAPYGKTDTASVLTEAIGYIQFLHDQVQTMSVPYMKSSNIKPARTAQACSSEEDGKGQQKRDLRSRG
ncbi:transcription factor bHLH110-like isoform X2 [Populus nigra]|uniref:transcription factor bHLH110-like isoform X2 n=1 Tax=Populus nigra TaxID=3691 RepID=UPI002B26A374|nr:transcription factor bHLH110-like isoform X2 [Populus nigra]